MIATFILAVLAVTVVSNINSEQKVSASELPEETLLLESWMGDPAYLTNVTLEEEVAYEAWMSDPDYLNDVIEVNEEIPLEDWMGDPNYLKQ